MLPQLLNTIIVRSYDAGVHALLHPITFRCVLALQWACELTQSSLFCSNFPMG
jgi:hypothetical protein